MSLENFAKFPEYLKKIEEIVDKEVENGLKNIFYVGTGGTYSYGMPFKYYADQISDMPVYNEAAPELVHMNHKQLGKGSLCIWTSATGNTKDVLNGMEFTRSKGAHNLALVEAKESPMEPLADNFFAEVPGDVMHALIFFAELRAFFKRGEFPKYEKLAEQFAKCGEAFENAPKVYNSRCIYYAARNNDGSIPHFVVGAGATYGTAYCWGMCVMEEMQWMRTKIINAAEFFHGAIELCEKDTPFIIVKGEDGGRELCERVERFIAPLTKEVLVFDTKEIELPVDDEFRPLLSSLVADSVVYTLMKPFEVERNHDLKVRRYYRQMEY